MLNEIIENLCSPEKKLFDGVVSRFRLSGPEAFDSHLDSIDVLGKANTVNERERSRRVRVALEALIKSGASYNSIIEKARHWPTSSRAAVLEVLPNELKPQLYSKNSSNEASQGVIEVLNDSGRREHEIDVGEDSAGSDRPVLGTVLLLGTQAATEGNSRFLRSKRFEVVRAGDLESLSSFLDHGICGIVVDGTWWNVVGSEHQEAVLDRILGFSTFAYLRIDQTNLSEHLCENIDDRFLRARFRNANATEFLCSDGCRLTSTDVNRLMSCSEVLTDGQ